MTVKEVIFALQVFPLDRNVYVFDPDGTAQIAQIVDEMPHLNLPEGILIPSDVCIVSRFHKDEYEE